MAKKVWKVSDEAIGQNDQEKEDKTQKKPSEQLQNVYVYLHHGFAVRSQGHNFSCRFWISGLEGFAGNNT